MSNSIFDIKEIKGPAVPYGFLRWDAAGAKVYFETGIPVRAVRGIAPVAISNSYSDLSNTPVLSTVATSGSFNDLHDKPAVPKNHDFKLGKLADVSTAIIPHGFLRWNNEGTSVEFQTHISLDDVSGLPNLVNRVAALEANAPISSNSFSVQSSSFSTLSTDLSTSFLYEMADVDYSPATAVDNSVLTWDATAQRWFANTSLSSFINLADTSNSIYGAALSNKYLRWNTAGTEIIYEENISALNITGLADVATTGDILDLLNVDYSTSRIKARAGLSVLIYDKLSNVWVDESVDVIKSDAAGLEILLSDLGDVALNAPLLSGEVLKYNDVLSQWSNSKLSFNDLSDKPTNSSYTLLGLLDTAPTPIPNGFLRWNAAGNQVGYTTTISASSVAGLATVAVTGNYADLTGTPVVPNVLNDLADVNAAPTSGDVLSWSGTEWVAIGSSISLELDDLTDVDTAGASPGQVLTFTGSAWAPTLLSAGTFIGLLDTDDTAVANGFVKWNAAGDALEYATTIDAALITGLPPVEFYDLLNNPFSNPPVLSDITDVNTSAATNKSILSYNAATSSWEASTYEMEWSVVNATVPVDTNKGYLVNTVSGPVELSLPEAPSTGDWVVFGDYRGTFNGNPLTISSSDPIMERNEPLVIDNKNALITLTYIDSVIGWKITDGIGEGLIRYAPVWQVINSDFTAVTHSSYLVNTTSNPVTVTLPADPVANDLVEICDYQGTFGNNPVTVVSTAPIMGLSEPLEISHKNASVTLTYIDFFIGWKVTQGVGEAMAAASPILGNDTIYVDTAGNDANATGTEQSPYGTLQGALDYIELKSIKGGSEVTVSMGPGVYIQSTPVINRCVFGHHVKIVGAGFDPEVEIGALVSVSGVSPDVSVEMQVADSSNINVDDFVAIYDVVVDETDDRHLVYEGLFKVIVVSPNSITVTSKHSMPTISSTFTGKLKRVKTVVQCVDTSGLVSLDYALKEISKIAFVGTGFPSTDGIVSGFNESVDYNRGGGSINLSEVYITGFGQTGVTAANGSAINVKNSNINDCPVGVRCSNVSRALIVDTALNSNEVGIEALFNSSVKVIDSTFAGSDIGIFAQSNGTIQCTGGLITFSETHAAGINSGGLADISPTTKINNTNGAVTFKAKGSGHIVVSDAGQDLVAADVTFNPNYKTMDVAVSGTAIIGRYS